MNRRRYLAGLGTAGFAGTAGCLDFVFGDELAFAASPVRVQPATADAAGYRRVRTTENTVEQTVEAGGESRDIVATNVHVEYGKAVSTGSLDPGEHAALFVAVTTPQVRVLDRSFNPLQHLSARQVAGIVQGQYDAFQSLSHREDANIRVGNRETTRSEFLTTARLADQRVDVRLHVTEFVELGDDFLLTLGLYPDLVDEKANVISLMEAVERDG
ncbi:MAG: DUF6517 family protein [Halovenus sp.]